MALRNPGNIDAAISLTREQFQYGFGNAISEQESSELYDRWTIPSPARPLFQAASANFNPHSQTKVETGNEERGPLLLTMGGKDHTVPEAISKSTYKKYRKSEATTDLVEFEDRGHSLTIDHGWKDVADHVLSWLDAERFVTASTEFEAQCSTNDSTRLTSSGANQASSSSVPPAARIVDTTGSAHRCSTRATAAVVPRGIESCNDHVAADGSSPAGRSPSRCQLRTRKARSPDSWHLMARPPAVMWTARPPAVVVVPDQDVQELTTPAAPEFENSSSTWPCRRCSPSPTTST